jgi:hypothetical protein
MSQLIIAPAVFQVLIAQLITSQTWYNLRVLSRLLPASSHTVFHRRVLLWALGLSRLTMNANDCNMKMAKINSIQDFNPRKQLSVLKFKKTCFKFSKLVWSCENTHVTHDVNEGGCNEDWKQPTKNEVILLLQRPKIIFLSVVKR